MKAHIIYRNYMNHNGEGMSVGGIQTYITNLSEVLKDMGVETVVYQLADKDFTSETNGIKVLGFRFEGKGKNLTKFLFKKSLEFINPKTDIVVFGSDTYIVDTPPEIKTIAIQHGIFWDKPERVGCSKIIFFLDYVYQAYKAWKTVCRIKKVDTLVCVDYNFVNWYRALVAHPQMQCSVIPNFTEIPTEILQKQKSDKINIMFARRFFPHRGSRLFASVAKRLLESYKNVHITVAGEGPDEEYLHNALDFSDRVEFIRYESSQSLEIHKDKHIAVVPTLGSEGTSLSLLEAMASQCAVVCTDVGGMTNIVLDGYNGLMVSPSEEKIYNAIANLVEDEVLREKVSQKAYETAKEAFSLEVWKERWKKVLQ